MCARVCVEMNTYDCIKRSSVVCFVWENNEEEEKKGTKILGEGKPSRD